MPEECTHNRIQVAFATGILGGIKYLECKDCHQKWKRTLYYKFEKLEEKE